MRTRGLESGTEELNSDFTFEYLSGKIEIKRQQNLKFKGEVVII